MIWFCVAITAAALLFACDHGPREKNRLATLSETEMTPLTTTAGSRPIRPAIDRMAVVELQTATFALG